MELGKTILPLKNIANSLKKKVENLHDGKVE
jgi:hypothetical protein